MAMAHNRRLKAIGVVGALLVGVAWFRHFGDKELPEDPYMDVAKIIALHLRSLPQVEKVEIQYSCETSKGIVVHLLDRPLVSRDELAKELAASQEHGLAESELDAEYEKR